MITKEIVEIELAREHGKAAVGIPRPFLGRPIPIKFYAVLVWIPQVQRLAYTVIAGSIQANARFAHPVQGIGKCGSSRIEDRGVKQPGCAGCWRRTALALPRV